MLAPASRFSKIVATGIRVPRKTHAPLTFLGMLSTGGHCDQSSAAMNMLLHLIVHHTSSQEIESGFIGGPGTHD
jgi:hypothetical protein